MYSIPPTSALVMWIRDVTEEGIEPNPGPRIISKNVNGLSAPAHRHRVFAAILADHRRDPISAILIQEHFLKKETLKIVRKENEHNFLILATPSKPNVAKGGGVAILIPITSIELKKGENIEDAKRRIRATARYKPEYPPPR